MVATKVGERAERGALETIRIRGARTHNLKNISLDLPRGRLVVITGVSGSGKSSLAFDTICAEGQRRYVESLSTYARQVMALLPRADVDEMTGLSPVISIEQKTTGSNPRSNVGTATEIVDYLRVLFARVGTPFCPVHGRALKAESVAGIVEATLRRPEGSKLMVLAPLPPGRNLREVVTEGLRAGFMRFRIEGVVETFEALPETLPETSGAVEVVVDRLRLRADQRERLAESVETALDLADGRVRIADMDSGETEDFSSKNACPLCDYTAGVLEPDLFSPNTPRGACPTCGGTGSVEAFDPDRVLVSDELSISQGALEGWGKEQAENFARIAPAARALGASLEAPWKSLSTEVRRGILLGCPEMLALDPPFHGVLGELERLRGDEESPLARALDRYRGPCVCPECGGSGLGRTARNVRLGDMPDAKSLADLLNMPLADLADYFQSLSLPESKRLVAERLLEAVRVRLEFLQNVGVGYLTLGRRIETLSGGEHQRIRLAGLLGSGLTGLLYVLDEPSIGLHPVDNARLIRTLEDLRDIGNTVLVVEHDEDIMRAADWIVDLGPGAGEAGGYVLAEGRAEDLARSERSVTGRYLRGEHTVPGRPPIDARAADRAWLELRGARGHNLKNATLRVPLGCLTVVSGPSGSGKSSLVNDTLLPALFARLQGGKRVPLPYADLLGAEQIDKVVVVDQSPIGRTPRSNPATYTGLFGLIREVFAQTQTARERGYGPGRFSFNTKGGRCEACQGDGVVRVEMQFLPDVYVTCEVCGGERYNRETLECRFKGRSIGDVLRMTVAEASELFHNHPQIERRLQALRDVGLGYVRLGQSAATLSGGEAQRVKLAAELARIETGRTFYVLDEPTTGLHFADVEELLGVLRRLTAQGNTVLVVEHNVEIMRTADWMVDLGPAGGEAGGRIVAEGTPAELSCDPESVTGPWL